MACTPAYTCKAALEEATRRWPNRNRASDGICGDSAHNKRKSDHNIGNAHDLTHDPAHGCDAHALARQVAKRRDSRIKYIISNRKIWYPTTRVWLPYFGTNPHTKHAHFSIKPGARNDTKSWWATSKPTTTTKSKGLKLDKEYEKDVTLDDTGAARIMTGVAWSKFISAYRRPGKTGFIKQPNFAPYNVGNKVQLVITEGPRNKTITVAVRRAK